MTVPLVGALSILLGASIGPEEIDKVEDLDLASIISRSELLAETTREQSPFFSVRIVRVRDLGECNGSPRTCPRTTLYVALSERDEHPLEVVYRLPARHDWRFVGWRSFPRKGTDLVEFELASKLPRSDPEQDWWDQVIHVLRADSQRLDVVEER